MRTPAAEYLIRQRVMALGRALPAAKDGNAASLHQARVATRRLRAALPIVGSGAKAEKLARSVRRLTRALGPLRELDVELLILDELEKRGEVPYAAVDRLRASIIEERQHLQADVRDRIDDFDIDKLRKRAVSVARRQGDDKRPRDAQGAAFARARAGRRARRLEAAIEDAAGLYLPDRLHAVRIAVKKLRYTLELMPRAASSRNAARVRALKQAQDLLGRMHDLEVLIARTRAVVRGLTDGTLRSLYRPPRDCRRTRRGVARRHEASADRYRHHPVQGSRRGAGVVRCRDRRDLHEPAGPCQTDGRDSCPRPRQQDVGKDAGGAGAGPLAEAGDERAESGGEAAPHCARRARAGARRAGGARDRLVARAAVQEGRHLLHRPPGTDLAPPRRARVVSAAEGAATPRSIAVVINPISGTGGRIDVARARAAQAAAFLSSRGCDPSNVFITERPGHARELALAAVERGITTIAAWGGDGTMNEIGTALAFKGAAFAGAERVIDAGDVDGRLFFNVAGIGLDARVAHRFAVDGLEKRGFSRYIAMTLRELSRYEPDRLTVTTPSASTTGPMLLVAIANGRQYGNGAMIAPHALLDDGRLDVITVSVRPLMRACVELPLVFMGRIERLGGVTMARTESVHITSPHPVVYHLDGEPIAGTLGISAQVRPRALTIRVPTR